MGSQLFSTVGVDTFVVPLHIDGTLKVTVVGGAGGDFDPGEGNITNYGGYGGYVTGALDVPVGTVLDLGIGGRGEDGTYTSTVATVGGGGPRPGGDGGEYGAGSTLHVAASGGGGSEVKIGSTVIAVGGGGGGGGTKSGLNSGARAGDGAFQTGSGQNGTPNAPTDLQGQGGRGGTLVGPGDGGLAGTDVPAVVGQPGVDGAGGGGGSWTQGGGGLNRGGGGGGGGGYFGAGGGGGSQFLTNAGRGGGGSSWSDPTYVTEDAGTGPLAHTSDGYILFEWEDVIPPVASFTADPLSGEAPLNVSFDATASSDADGTIVSYAWDYGDGDTGAGAIASHTYLTAGTFTVTLTVTDNDGATDTATAEIVVAEPPPPPPCEVRPIFTSVDFGPLEPGSTVHFETRVTLRDAEVDGGSVFGTLTGAYETVLEAELGISVIGIPTSGGPSVVFDTEPAVNVGPFEWQLEIDATVPIGLWANVYAIAHAPGTMTATVL